MSLALGLLLLAGGCALLPPQPGGSARSKEIHLEKLLAGQNYRQALRYLPELAPDLDAAAYAREERRLLALIAEFEAATAEQAVLLRDQGQLAAAVRLVGQALEKTPDSARLLELNTSLSQELERRQGAAERRLLLSRATYLSSQLRGFQELEPLHPLSWLTRWRLTSMADSLAALRPDLLDCGRKALEEGERELAESCLLLAEEIEKSVELEQLLTRARSATATPPPALEPEAEPPPVVSPPAKKSRPAPPPGPSLAELEGRLRQEIAAGEITKGYATLAQLRRTPAAPELLLDYRAQLDRIKERQIAKYLDDGATLYRGGMIPQAREAWRLVLELDPDNQVAREKIARADRVLKKLQDLQESQQKMSPAQ